ncbi:MAG: lipid A deacylase LpxR family protein [Thiovulaceae bacterium]|nr:lipid A deacylase LpxR family protein [Sulfurimonadaceae bacterium]
MKILFLTVLIFLNLFAQESYKRGEIWELERSNFYFENDMYFDTDYDYTAGLRLSWLFHIKHPKKNIYDISPLDFGGSSTYRSFALVNQIFTPKNKEQKTLITDDRPYAGWTYFETGLHKSSKRNLRSINLKVGIVGPLSGAENFQNFLHKVIGAQHVNGWENQLHNELGINLKYTHKWRFLYSDKNFFESAIVPFGEMELGNVSTKATAGFSIRIGYNIPKDFGVSSIDIGGEDGIPSYKENLMSNKKVWSFSFNLNAATSAVARDIFLDGNTDGDSHSIKKERIIGYTGGGFSLRYKRFILDFIRVYNTKKFNSENGGHDTGSIVLSWIYN